MNYKQIKNYIRLHWVKLLLILIGSIIGLFTLIVLMAGINAMINLESFYNPTLSPVRIKYDLYTIPYQNLASKYPQHLEVVKKVLDD